jgi:hypothetical protein
MYPQCIGECGWSPVVLGSDLGWPDGEDVLRADVLSSVCHLAHWEPRDRLPTLAEQKAARRMYGEDVGWMVLSGKAGGFPKYVGEIDMATLHYCGPDAVGPVTCWPCLADGRPVGWPEVKHG